MKKIISLIALILSLIFMLTGCIRTELGVKLKDNGTGSVSATVSIRKDVYEMLKENGSDPFDGKTAEQIMIDNQAYLSYTETNDNLTYKEIENKLLDFTVDENDSVKLFKAVSVEKNGGLFYNSYTFKATTNAMTGNSEDEDNGKSVNDIYKFTINVTMPGNIAQSKGGTVNGNSIIFDIDDLTQENDLAVYSDSNNTVTVITIIAVLIIIAAAFVFFMKRKQG